MRSPRLIILQRELVQLRVGDAVVLDVVLPGIFAVGDLRAAARCDRCRGTCRGSPGSRPRPSRAPKRSNSSAMRRAPITQACTSLSRSAASMSGTRVLRLMMVNDRLVAHARVVEPDRRDREAFLEHGGGGARHRAGHAAADVVVMAERLDVGDHLAVVEHRHGAAQVGQVPDAALGQVGVVHQEDVARPHRLGREVAHHRVRHRRIGAPGELAAVAVEQADAIVVRLADHRASARCARWRIRSRPRSS